ncbi:hypothetical protein GCM10009801_66630 [Streptomyces albiaxialis]|uniref:DUF4267 domain-containing protein n=1 Tax=Streptomyces albiaxialis TaxID=329523 RepID=A0ABN2WSU8_9ACTN
MGVLRAVGAATAVYGAVVTARPGWLARPSGLPDDAGTRTSLRPLAWRDVASGLALLTAPDGDALRTAAWVRMAADFGDAALLGATLPGRGRRAGAVAVSVGWGALSAWALVSSPPSRRGSGSS